jgi:hypothetical protein
MKNKKVKLGRLYWPGRIVFNSKDYGVIIIKAHKKEKANVSDQDK